MRPEVVGVFIPIIAMLVLGIILVSFFFFRSREKQMLIEKGMDAQTIKEFYEGKKDPFFMTKFGIVCIGFGLGLGFGIMLEETTDQGYWVPLFLFVITGIGFVAANIITRKLEKNKN